MINTPYNVPLAQQIMPAQNVPVQTSHNNFLPFQQPQTNTQQMQTNPVYPLNPQDQYKSPLYQVQQSDMFMANQYVPNVLQARPCPPIFHPFNNVPPPVQTQPNYGPLLQNILEQIRGQVSNTAPIFILPGGCQQSTNHHQQAGTGSQVGGPQATGQPTSFNYPSSVHCPPSFYPFPIPLPVYEPFAGQTRNRESSRGCGCCHRRQESLDSKNYSLNCCCNLAEQEDHRCTATNDDTICSKRNCPASVSLQALASQLLSLQGIISCAATRLILRKVPGSNITSTMEDTMEKAQKAITMLTKDQLLAESRNAHQVNALINLHMTTNPPANIVPLLTLIQLKVNVLKAQIESLINKKVMECQGFGYEVETSGPIDPTVLTMKTNEELRHLLSALRQKECDERVNVNFSLYHSQRVIAEARLNNVQAKICQVEAEFDRRRCVSMPGPSLTSRVIQQFAGSTCTFGYAQTKLFEPYPPDNPLESPDPFLTSIRNPRRLYLKPREPGQETTGQKDQSKATSTSQDCPSSCTDAGTGESTVNSSKEQSVGPRSSDDSCSCHDSSSEDSIEDKKKLRLRIDRVGKVSISSPTGLQDASLAYLSPNVLTTLCNCKPSTGSVSDSVEILEIPKDEGKTIELVDLDLEETEDVEEDKTTGEKVNGDKIPKEEGKPIDEQHVESEQFKDETPEQETPDGQVPIKEEHAAADTTEFDPKRVKVEPDTETTKKTDLPIKKEVAEEKPHFSTTVHIDLKPTTMKTKEHMELKQKVKKKISIKKEAVEDKPSHFVATAHIDLDPTKMKMEEHVEPKQKIKKTSDTPVKQGTLHNGRSPIKEERVSKEFDLGRVKIEPGAVETTKKTDISIKKEAVDKPSHFVATAHIKTEEPASKQKIKDEIPDSPRKQEARDGQLTIEEHESGAKTKHIKVEDVKHDVLKPETKIKQENGQKEATASIYTKTGSSATPKKVKTELYIELKPKLESQIKDTKIHEKSTVKDVPKDKVPPPIKEEVAEKSADEEKTYFGVKLKKTGRLPQPKSTTRENEHDSKKDEIKPHDAGSREKSDKQQATGSATPTGKQKIGREPSSEVMKSYLGVTLKKKGEPKRSKAEDDKSKDGKHGNVQIISMMTRVEYDKSYGDFDEWIDLNKCIVETTKGQEEVDSSLISMDNQLYKSQLTEHIDNKNGKCDEKNVNGIAQFPPLKHVGRRTVIDITKNIFHQKEIESGSLKSPRDRNTSYHPDSEIENNVVSTIYSLIESRLASFGSFLSSIPHLQDIVSNLYYKSSTKTCEHDLSSSEETDENKKSVLEKDDWILLSWDDNLNDDDGTSGEGRKGFSNVHKMKQSIIVDKKAENYMVIGGSASGQFRELSRNGLQRPYRTRRTLVIRSRLKNPGKSRHEPQRPFTIVKRFRKNKVSVSEEMKLKTSEHLCRVSDTMENDQNNINSNKAMLSKNCSFLSVGHSLSENERTSMHDHFRDSGVNKRT